MRISPLWPEAHLNSVNPHSLTKIAKTPVNTGDLYFQNLA
jgi:hypothetical protein